MLSILNETKTKVFQQEQLTVRIFPSIQEMGSAAAKEVGDQICRLLESKPEINMIFAAAPSQNEFLSHLIHDKRIDWTRINATILPNEINIPATMDEIKYPSGFFFNRLFFATPALHNAVYSS